MITPEALPEHKLAGSTEAKLEEAVTDTYLLLNETTRKYREAYRQLEEQFESLNRRLEQTNLELRKTLEEKTWALEEKDQISNYLNNILESLNGGVVVVNPEGFITLFNQAAEKIVGITQNEALFQPYEHVVGLDAGREKSALHALATGAGQSNQEKELRRSDDRRIPLGFSTSLVRDSEGNILGAVEVFNDLTEVKHLEAELQRVHTLAALGKMAATVAHEIRNPLGGIAGFAALLERDLAAEDPHRRLVHKITEGVARLNRIVTSLLNYTRPLKLNRYGVDLAQMVEEATAFFEIAPERRDENIVIHRSFPNDAIICSIDPEQFQQIVLNLLQNAAQAMPSGGEITLEIASGGSETPDSVLVHVRDTGVGMETDVRDKLFTPFFTTKEDGTGLGLATSKKIIDAHGGGIRVASTPGVGTCFTICLPK